MRRELAAHMVLVTTLLVTAGHVESVCFSPHSLHISASILYPYTLLISSLSMAFKASLIPVLEQLCN